MKSAYLYVRVRADEQNLSFVEEDLNDGFILGSRINYYFRHGIYYSASTLVFAVNLVFTIKLITNLINTFSKS